MANEKEYLVYVEKINEHPNSKGMYEYEFYFSETPEIAWGVDWDQQCPSACDRENLRPDFSTYNKIEKLYTIIPFQCIGENSCYSIQDCTEGICAVCYEDISEYEDYPEPIRLVFHFGEDKETVEDKLAQRSQFFNDANKIEKPSE